MSNNQNTHVVQNKPHHRAVDTDGTPDRETFDVGDEIDPRDSELSAFPDRFEKQDDLEIAGEDVDEATTTEEEAEDNDDVDERAAANTGYTEDEIDDMEYAELRTVAANVDGVSGRGAAEEIRQALKDHYGETSPGPDSEE